MKRLVPLGDTFLINPKLAIEIGFKETVVLITIKKLLDVSNNTHNSRKWIYYSYRQLKEDHFPFWSINTTSRVLKSLSDQQLIEHRFLDDKDKINILQNKGVCGAGVGNNVCNWCGVITLVLHEHHYPITKIDGGEDTVLICSNCHNEFHLLEYSLQMTRKGDVKFSVYQAEASSY